MGKKGGGRRGASRKAGGGGGGRQVDVEGNVSAEAVKEANEAVKNLPDKVWKTLDSTGAKVVISERLVDAMPELAGRQPRGWPTGSTWENVDGVYSGGRKMALVGEKFKDFGTGVEERSKRIGGVLRHEVGHAFDDALGRASEKAAFVKAYEADVKRIADVDKPRFQYFLQKGDAGRSEAYAELFGQHFGGGGARNDLINVFPRTYKVLKKDLRP